jgi:hypothetical protein
MGLNKHCNTIRGRFHEFNSLKRGYLDFLFRKKRLLPLFPAADLSATNALFAERKAFSWRQTATGKSPLWPMPNSSLILLNRVRRILQYNWIFFLGFKGLGFGKFTKFFIFNSQNIKFFL